VNISIIHFVSFVYLLYRISDNASLSTLTNFHLT